MKWLRSLIAVAAGYAIIAIFMRAMTGSFLRTLALVVLSASLAGFSTAYIAGRREIPHAAALGFIMLAISLSIRGEPRPIWLQIAVGGCGPVAAMFGAAVRLLTKGSNLKAGQQT